MSKGAPACGGKGGSPCASGKGWGACGCALCVYIDNYTDTMFDVTSRPTGVTYPTFAVREWQGIFSIDQETPQCRYRNKLSVDDYVQMNGRDLFTGFVKYDSGSGLWRVEIPHSGSTTNVFSTYVWVGTSATGPTGVYTRTDGISAGPATIEIKASNYTTSPTAVSMTRTGGSGSFTFTVVPGRKWKVILTGSGLTASPTSGGPSTGTITVNYTVNSFTSGCTRTLTARPIMSDGPSFLFYESCYSPLTITQAGCCYTFSGGGTITTDEQDVDVTVTLNDSGCDSNATTSTAPWLTITNPTGTGSRTITLHAEENTGTAVRVAIVYVAGQTAATITQEACGELTVDPTEMLDIDGDGDSRTLTLTMSNESCTWEITDLPAWITASATSGTGSASVTLTFAANESTTERSTSFAVNGQTVSITQAGLSICTDCPADWSGFPATLTLTVAGITGGCEASNGTITLTKSGSEYTDASGKWLLYCYTDFGTGEAIYSLDFIGDTDFLQFQRVRASDCDDEPTGSFAMTSNSCGGTPTASIA